MSSAPQPHRHDEANRSERERRDRELVRRTALLLSQNLPLREVFGQLCVVLSAFVDVQMVIVCSAIEGEARCEFAMVDGVAGVPSDPTIPRNSVTYRVLESARPMLFRRASDWPVQILLDMEGHESRPQSGIFVPIVFGGANVGVLSVQSSREEAYDEADIEPLETCALYLGALMHDEAQRREAERYARLASMDGLTGLASRRHFDIMFDKEFRRCERDGAALSIVLLDVDYFKAFNDVYGHVAGDTCLRQVARAIGMCAGRPGDVVARYGGEEFAAILPSTDAAGAVQVAERMRAAVFDLAIPHERSSLERVTVSVGVETVVPAREGSKDVLLAAADGWLYRAKENGRNRVAAPSYESTTQGAGRRSVAAHNLPQPRSSFVGRGGDVARLRDTIAASRLVTIVGPGGAGKTRTAVEAARGVADRFADGIWFTDLTSVGDAAGLHASIAATLRLGTVASDDPSSIAGLIGSRSALIVLDNCEHVLEACAHLVDAVLDRAPGMRFLATSREPLGVPGETTFRLPMLAASDAVDLFRERARQAGVEVADDATLREIVARLDGMPLAIELAAARLAAMTPLEVLRALNERLELENPSARTVHSRQQTLSALLDWSFAMLSEAEQRAFARLSIFESGWSVDAAQAVCSDERCPDVPRALQSLVAKSLVERYEQDGRSRFRFLNVTREYARAALDRFGDGELMRERHARYFADLAERRAEELRSSPMTRWLHQQRAERENYEKAIAFALAASDDALAQRIVVALRDWFLRRGVQDFRELLPAFEQRLAAGRLDPRAAAAFSLATADIFGVRDYGRAHAYAQTALELYGALGDAVAEGHALERVAAAQRYLKGAVDRELRQPMLAAIDAAKRYGEKRLAAWLLRSYADVLASMAFAADAPSREREVLTEALDLLRQSGDEERTGMVLGRIGVAEFWAGNYDAARATCRAALTLLEQSDEPWNAGLQFMNLGLYEVYRGDFTAARVALRKAIETAATYGHRFAVATSFDTFALLAHRTHDVHRAVRLLAFAETLFSAGTTRRQLRLQRLRETFEQELRNALDAETFAREWEAGSHLTLADALHEAEAV